MKKTCFKFPFPRCAFHAAEALQFQGVLWKTRDKEPNWIAGVKPPSRSAGDEYDRDLRKRMPRATPTACRSTACLQRGRIDPCRDEQAGADCPYSRANSVHWHGRFLLFFDCGFGLDAIPWKVFVLCRCGGMVALLEQSMGLRLPGSILTTASGESAELVQLCRQERGKPLALLCNNPKSPCWSLTEQRLPMLAGPEYGNATKTYTNATAASIVLASHITGHAWKTDAAQMLEVYAESLEQAFSLRRELEQFCRRCREHRTCRPWAGIWCRDHGRPVHSRDDGKARCRSFGRRFPAWAHTRCQRDSPRNHYCAGAHCRAWE